MVLFAEIKKSINCLIQLKIVVCKELSNSDVFVEEAVQHYRVSQKSSPLQLSTLFSLGLSLFA